MMARMAPVLTHVALQVEDIEATLRFYREYCGMSVTHERASSDGSKVVWMAEPGREHELVLVLMPGGRPSAQASNDYSHFGFAVGSRSDVDALAKRAEAEDVLAWPPSDEPYPVGYYCGVRDPNGNVIEFSYGQPLGPGALSPGTQGPGAKEPSRR
jgi:catechol 2,3-dioxygenase-like lactoylglutathione lyase family enzyme